MKPRSFLCALVGGLVFLAARVEAQWLTQQINLKTGWSAVYLHVDPSHATLTELVAETPIHEVWMWAPSPSTIQFFETPQNPINNGSRWISWKRADGVSSVLQSLVGNVACLVYSTEDYIWNVQGRPVLPDPQWTVSGLNFLGFPTVPVDPPDFEAFLDPAPLLHQSADIFRYPGGNLGAGNPTEVFAYRTTAVPRGEAFWVRAGAIYNRYFGPFQVVSAGAADFSDQTSVFRMRLRNLTANELTTTLALVASETPPSGQTAILAVPPLLVRGDLDTSDLTYDHTPLPVGTPYSWTLAAKGQPGSEIEIVLGLDRSAISAEVDALLAGILRFTDSLGHTQVDMPVSATVASKSGLWVGGAAVTEVGQYLKSYERDADDQPMVDADGHYIVSGINTELGAVPRYMPLRLIVHNPASGSAVLLQRAYTGVDRAAEFVVTTQESELDPDALSDARRISAVHLPWTEENAGWVFDGNIGEATSLTATVTTPFEDQASNPFLHTYHPDHDNLDATFGLQLTQGSESFEIVRQVTLELTAPSDDFESRTTAGSTVVGNYLETIKVRGLARAGDTFDTRQFEVRGAFILNRIADVPVLTTP